MNLFVFEKEDFLKGTFDNIDLIDDILFLKENSLNGSYESQVIKLGKFKRIIASWNCNTSESTYVEVFVSFCKDENWSMWFSYGKWSNNGFNKGSISKQEDDLGKINVDVINVLDGVSDKIKFKVVLERKDSKTQSPSLRRIVVSTYHDFTESKLKSNDIDIEVPMISQMKIPGIGAIICSPVSLSMVINNYGYSKEPFDVAQSCFDNGAGIYGNWVYNVAYASEIGFKSYVRFCETPDVIVDYISSGKPLVASIKTKDIKELKGAPQTYPSGHLIVIRGFSNKDKTKIIVNDPASKEVENVKRYYEFSDFIKVWNKIIYVLELEK